MFEFGKNWRAFSQAALDRNTVQTAQESVSGLLGRPDLAGLSFLHVGSGSGLFSIAAARLGAGPVTGLDIDPECVETARANSNRFPGPGAAPQFLQMSVLDEQANKTLAPADIVYAWGSLHHTGSMHQAMANAAGLVKPGGALVLAIYNRHWSSPAWSLIKKTYNVSPRLIKLLMIYLFTGVLFTAKALVTRRNLLRQQRGMYFFYDVINWVGGYPYEYATTKEITRYIEGLGFRTVRTVAPQVPTGCNEFVSQKTGGAA
jgi:2-polyprenyl-6-hydroxyphenyl methylase/3-demethylubiquinone-9 3-methyltransferase